MKKLARFGYSTAGMIGADGGDWVRYDDAMQALRRSHNDEEANG